MELIHCIEECCVDVITTGRKVAVGDRGVDTQLSADGRLVEVCGYYSDTV